MTQTSPPEPYVLGHNDEEQRRLITQARHIAPLTRQLLAAAGLRAGMRVLDFGCGLGDGSLLLAEYVGESGLVVGMDRAPDAIAVAAQRMQSARCLRFVAGDQHALSSLSHEPFDAVFGRLVLMHQPDPAALLTALKACVRPGGLLVFQELSLPETVLCINPSPTLLQAVHWMRQAFLRAGVETAMGLKLYDVFVQAGLPAPQMQAQGLVGTGTDAASCDYFVQTLRSLQPVMSRLGMELPSALRTEHLADQIQSELQVHGPSVWPLVFGAWCRLPTE
ncbi:MAG: class I SAM-dependent methyltransferase [Polyangia bacterium]